jgi:FolB domain-containing protein
MDYVTIDQMRVRGVHGCHKYERESPQDFLVSLRVGTDLRAPGTSDALADTIDFDFLKSAVADAFAGARHYLIEALAEEIAAAILKDERAKEATVSIQKPDVWPDAVPGISITRAK